jgi:V/A-type H+-transporting ATPase subunit E
VSPTARAGPPRDEAAQLAALIRQQGEEEAAQAAAKGREQAEQILAAARQEAEAIRAAAQREGETRGERRAAEILAVATARRRMNLLQARESLIDEALARVRARLKDLASLPGAADQLAELIREGLAALPAGPVRARIAPGDAALLAPPVLAALGAGQWELRVEPSAVPGGGVILETADGRLSFDNSLDARGRRRRDRLRRLAASVLLPDGGDSAHAP